MTNIYIKNAKNKMKKAMRAKKKNNQKNRGNVPTHEEAVEAAVKAAHIYLKGYI
tara:strand:- start:381 stop:542 length:162 start_codon:yes stop_codon:yes gene_type:complete